MRRLLVLLWLSLLAVPAAAQPVFRDIFPAEEYAERRARLFDRIGDGVAILIGTTERPGEQPFRQGNQFFYLTGVAEPRAIAVLDGKTRETTIFLLPANERNIASKYGPGELAPGAAAAAQLGVTRVLPRDAFAAALAEIAKAKRTLWTPFRPEVLGSASAYEPILLARIIREDPWDGRPSREEAFRLKLMGAAPGSEIRDLDPLIDRLRAIKSPREIALLREATRLTDRGILRAMHAARPGMFEYQLQAESEYEFTRGGALGAAYFALVATGKNSWYTHYHYNTAALVAGDLVQYDYAPDYKYYASDVTRLFPASGRFTAYQREYYGLYLQLYRALLAAMRVHERPETIRVRALGEMEKIVAKHRFSTPALQAAFATFLDQFRRPGNGWLGHAVGMEVHDVYADYQTLEPGMVFTIEPQLRLPEDHVGVRLEDMILVTPQGIEILSDDLPLDADAIERFMAAPLPRDLR